MGGLARVRTSGVGLSAFLEAQASLSGLLLGVEVKDSDGEISVGVGSGRL